MRSTLGSLRLSQTQADQLQVKARSRWSPYLEHCCLLVSANVSYQRAEEDIEVLTGVKVSHSTMQRLVQRQDWSDVTVSKPIAEMSLDGGMIRLRTEVGQPCEWREYKALAVDENTAVAYFKDNEALLNWVNHQPRHQPVCCLGDGHDGVWNLFAQVGTPGERMEILDWYHLSENVHKLKATTAQLAQLKQFLWSGQVEQTIQTLKLYQYPGTTRLIHYLQQHRHRIINYEHWQAQGHSVGSGRVEALIKQISARVKLAGAQWLTQSVPKLLKHRCAYLNGALTSQSVHASA